jgi:hypothetical protein
MCDKSNWYSFMYSLTVLFRRTVREPCCFVSPRSSFPFFPATKLNRERLPTALMNLTLAQLTSARHETELEMLLQLSQAALRIT